MMVRQGDLLITQVQKIPKGFKARTDKNARVLAEGEVTGHFHRLDDGTVFQKGSSVDTLVFQADKLTTLSHDEHDPISFPPGIYEVKRQREYSPRARKRSVRVSD